MESPIKTGVFSKVVKHFIVKVIPDLTEIIFPLKGSTLKLRILSLSSPVAFFNYFF